MIKVLRITHPDCNGCMGASFGDCDTCGVKTQEVTLCADCRYKADNVMHREKLMCKKLHTWVEPYDFCAWGKRRMN